MENVLSRSYEPNKRVKETEKSSKQINPKKAATQPITLSKAPVPALSEKMEPSWIQEGIYCVNSSWVAKARKQEQDMLAKGFRK